MPENFPGVATHIPKGISMGKRFSQPWQSSNPSIPLCKFTVLHTRTVICGTCDMLTHDALSFDQCCVRLGVMLYIIHNIFPVLRIQSTPFLPVFSLVQMPPFHSCRIYILRWPRAFNYLERVIRALNHQMRWIILFFFLFQEMLIWRVKKVK